MYDKLVIISTNDVDDSIITLFGIEDLIKAGLDIEYWNVSQITTHEQLSPLYIKGLHTFNIKSYRNLILNLKKIKKGNGKVLFITYMNFFSKTALCYLILSYFKVHILYCINGCFPNYRIRKKIKIKNSIHFLINKIWRILLRTPLFYPEKFELHTCLKAERGYKRNNKTIILDCNSTDYERYLKLPRTNLYNLTQSNYIVYVDQNITLHPDTAIIGYSYINRDNFYKKINKAFKQIEENYGKKIIIAAHPTSSHYKINNPYQNRKIVYGDTISLIKNSYGVIGHFSTALLSSVLYDVPIILLTSDDINEKLSVAKPLIESLSKELDCANYNLDYSEEFLFWEINKSKYYRFKYDYLTTPNSENETNSNLLLKLLKNE